METARFVLGLLIVMRLEREKETLLKEVQHRIKNNMNTMTSLLSLQANSFRDTSAIQALSDLGETRL